MTDKACGACHHPEELHQPICKGCGCFKVSYSRLDKYACPKRYWFRYVAKEPEPENKYGQLGKAFHARVEARLTGKEPPTPIIPIELAMLYRDMMAQADELASTVKKDAIVGVEERAFLPLEVGDRQVVIEVVLDLLAQWEPTLMVVTDWKTGFSTIGEEDAQMPLYAWAAFKMYPKTEKVLTQIYKVRLNKLVQQHFTRADANEFEVWLKEQVRRMITDTEFKAIPSTACRICPYLNKCEAGKAIYGKDITLQVVGAAEVRVDDEEEGKSNVEVAPTLVSFTMEAKPIETAADAARAGQGVAFARAIAEAYELRLREYCKRTGQMIPVTASKSWGYHPKRKKVVTDLGAARKALKDAGLKEDEYLRLDLVKSRPLLGDGKRALPELKRAVTEVVQPEWGLRNPKTDEEDQVAQ